MSFDVTAYYRDLHRHPELSGQEQETAQYIFDTLTAWGYAPVRMGKTGVTADLVSDPEAPWLLLRADMDALPVTEATGLPFASEHPGVMHACGHDAHVSMLLAAAGRLLGQRLPQNIRFVFQPAEEVVLGAKELLSLGAMPENCKAAFAMHVWPNIPLGELATRPGPLMASGDVLRVTFPGRSVHCAKRETGADALQAALRLAQAFPKLEALAGGDGTMLFCGSLHGGTTHNVVAGEAWVYGTLRSYSEDSRQKILQALEEESAAAAKQYGTAYTILRESSCPVLVNDGALVEETAGLFPHMDCDAPRTLAAEDFACYQALVPGAMLWLGLGDSVALHTEKLFVPDAVLRAGEEAWLAIARHPWAR